MNDTESMIEDAKNYLKERHGKPDKITPRGIAITTYPRYIHLLAKFCEENEYTQEDYDSLVNYFRGLYSVVYRRSSKARAHAQ